MAEESKSLLHARHNDSTIKYLDKSPDHLDWVITTCFYSSLHYVRHYLFPMPLKTGDGKSYKIKSFDEYCRHHRYDGISKHEKLLNLVEQRCPEISAEYNQLMDMCSLARYRDYITGRPMSNLAKALHKTIKEFCDKKQ